MRVRTLSCLLCRRCKLVRDLGHISRDVLDLQMGFYRSIDTPAVAQPNRLVHTSLFGTPRRVWLPSVNLLFTWVHFRSGVTRDLTLTHIDCEELLFRLSSPVFHLSKSSHHFHWLRLADKLLDIGVVDAHKDIVLL